MSGISPQDQRWLDRHLALFLDVKETDQLFVDRQGTSLTLSPSWIRSFFDSICKNEVDSSQTQKNGLLGRFQTLAHQMLSQLDAHLEGIDRQFTRILQDQEALFTRQAMIDAVHDASEYITRWRRSTGHVFLFAEPQGGTKELFSRMNRVLQAQLKAQAQPFEEHQEKVVRQALFFYELQVLETKLDAPLPLKALFALFCGQELTKKEQSDYNNFLEAIVKAHKASTFHAHLTLENLYGTLKLVFERCASESPDGSFFLALSRIRDSLEKKKCTIFQQSNKSYRHWWNLAIEKKSECIAVKESTEDRFKVFVWDETQVVKFSPHNGMLLLSFVEELRKTTPEGHPALVRVLRVDDRGALYLERLSYMLHQEGWWRQEERVIAFIHLIQRMIQQKFVLENGIRSLGFDRTGAVRAIHPCKKSPFNFEIILKLVLQASQGNLELFCRIMEESRLTQHPIFGLYQALVPPYLKKEEGQVKDLVSPSFFRKDPLLFEEKEAVLKRAERIFFLLNSFVKKQNKPLSQTASLLFSCYQEVGLLRLLAIDSLETLESLLQRKWVVSTKIDGPIGPREQARVGY